MAQELKGDAPVWLKRMWDYTLALFGVVIIIVLAAACLAIGWKCLLGIWHWVS